MKKSIDEIVARALASIRIPKSAFEIHRLATDPDAESATLLAAVETDPALAARLLRLANSSIYSRGIDVTSLDQALKRVGNREIADLALALASASQFSNMENELMRTSSFMNHSLSTAVLARSILARCKQPTDSVFCAGLLHDLGLLALFAINTDEMSDVLNYSLDLDQVNLVAAENALLGYDHTMVGELIAQDWGLPEAIVQTMRHHHKPSDADEEYSPTVASVALANLLVSTGVSKSEFTDQEALVYEQAGEILTMEKINGLERQMLDSAEKETAELQAVF
ncbi:MAG: HDOD domain-containing protein [Woeseiaceae bacterium]